MRNRRKANRQPKEINRQKNPPQITTLWGRAASEYRPGLFIKQYFEKHMEACCADIFYALDKEIESLNKERIHMGEKPFRRPNYLSFAKYFHWFLKLGLIERTGRQEPAIYHFLQKRVFYRLTSKGRTEVTAWEDPIAAAHPEFR